MNRDTLPERKEGLRHVSEFLLDAIPPIIEPRRPTFSSLTSRVKAGLHALALAFRVIA